MTNEMKEKISTLLKEIADIQFSLDRYFKGQDFSPEEFIPESELEAMLKRALIELKEYVDLIRSIYED